MWHRPGLLTATADLLLLGGAFVFATVAALAMARLPWFPLRQVEVMQPLRETGRAELEAALRGALGPGGFWTVNTERVRSAVEQLPWVRRAEVRRVWPDRLAIGIEEHVAVARWGAGSAQLLNDHGEVFFAKAATLPSLELSGPLGTAGEVLARHRDFGNALSPLDTAITRLELSPRLAWQMKLANGLTIELGREQSRVSIGERLRQFVAAYRDLLGQGLRPAAVVDLRYPNGFAVRGFAMRAASGGGALN